MHEYEDEVGKRWGDTDAYRQSQAKTSKYSKDDFHAAKVDQEAATELFVYAFGNSLPIDSPKAQEAVRAHRDAHFFHISGECESHLLLTGFVVGGGAALNIYRTVLSKRDAVLRGDGYVFDLWLLANGFVEVVDDALADFDVVASVFTVA